MGEEKKKVEKKKGKEGEEVEVQEATMRVSGGSRRISGRTDGQRRGLNSDLTGEEEGENGHVCPGHSNHPLIH